MMSFVSELVYSHVVETFIASYVLITVPFGVVLNTIAVLDFPLAVGPNIRITFLSVTLRCFYLTDSLAPIYFFAFCPA